MEELSYEIIHDVPASEALVARHNFMRGQISAYENLVGLAVELHEWKEAKK